MEIRTLAEGLGFPEGPVALAAGSVLLVEIFAGTLTRVSPDGTKMIVARPGGGPNGAALGPDGKCYICNNGGFRWHIEGSHRRPLMQADDYSGGRIERIDLETSVVEPGVVEKGPWPSSPGSADFSASIRWRSTPTDASVPPPSSPAGSP